MSTTPTGSDLPRADSASDAGLKPSKVFICFIPKGKVHAPFGAQVPLKRTG